MGHYQNRGPVTCDHDFDTSAVKGKSAIVTGGANGLGEAYVRALVKAGAYVTFGDIDQEGGKRVESEMKGSANLVTCDVTKWRDQRALFKDAIANSPNHRIDIVVANAGIAAADDIFHTDPQQEEPEEPQFKTLRVNGTGALYTTKLALHYFRRQYALDREASKDQLLVLQSSLAGYVDLETSVQYCFSKFGLRSTMRVLRRTEPEHGIRVNNICPWFVRTKINSPEKTQGLDATGVEWATVEDAATALLKCASDTNINGRAFGIFHRSLIKEGYVDLNSDDYKEGDFLKPVEDEVLNVFNKSRSAAASQ